MTLRRRILLLSLGSSAAVLALFSLPLAVLLHSAAADRTIAAATDQAQGVADYLSSDPSQEELTEYVDRVNVREEAFPLAVATANGTVIGESVPGLEQLRDQELAENNDGGTGDADGDETGGSTFRPTSDPTVESVTDGRIVVIEVGKGHDLVVVLAADERVNALAGQRLLLLAAAGVLLLGLTAAASQLVTRRMVHNLAETAQAADALGAGNLAERAPEDGPPEVRRVAQALNGLAGRIDDLLLAERELVADLSHRLRTPLTAVRLDVDSLTRGYADPTDVPDLLVELTAHVDQFERTLTAVIHAARRVEREGARRHADAATVVREAVDFWRPLAEDQSRTVTLVSGHDDLPGVRCDTDELRAALDALLENCLAHTPEGTAIAIEVVAGGTDQHGHAEVVVEIADRGAGIPATAIRRGRSDRGSTGLGLDIARSCAQESGGRLEIEQRDGWSVVRLVLGTA